MQEIFIERRENILRIAIKENGKLYECFIEEEKEHGEPHINEIYKGKVRNIVPGLAAAFIDIGYKKDVQLNMNNGRRYKQGDDVVVEVITEQNGNKCARVTDCYSIAGRNVVLSMKNTGIEISKRIKDDSFIERLKSEISVIDGVMITIRTNAINTSIDVINEEIEIIRDKLFDVKERSKYMLKPQLVYGDDILITKVLGDNINKETSKIVVDSDRDFKTIKKILTEHDDIEIELYEGIRNLFDYYNIEKEILSLRNNVVNLRSGGQIVIDKTEALYAIDVNSSKNIKGSRSENAKHTNIEAAKEIGRQIMLRNISGTIIIDFIKMKNKSDKDMVVNSLKKSLEKDKNNTKVYPFTELDLVQIARRKRGKSIYHYIEEKCDICCGHGARLKLSYVEMLIKNEIIRSEGENNINDFYIEINKIYEESVKNDIFTFLNNIDGLTKNIYINYVQGSEVYKVEPLLFKQQKESLKMYKVSNIEIC